MTAKLTAPSSLLGATTGQAWNKRQAELELQNEIAADSFD